MSSHLQIKPNDPYEEQKSWMVLAILALMFITFWLFNEMLDPFTSMGVKFLYTLAIIACVILILGIGLFIKVIDSSNRNADKRAHRHDAKVVKMLPEGKPAPVTKGKKAGSLAPKHTCKDGVCTCGKETNNQKPIEKINN